tara:strand:+ start:19034 stop:19855 length:822 start_codon:yes stop_codon:yes gene_type:complete
MPAETLNIVGAGLAGSFVERIAAKNKIKTRIFDERNSYAASPYSENIFSFGWADRLGHEIAEVSKRVLKDTVQVDEVYFRNKNLIKSYRVQPKNILVDHIKDSVTAVSDEGVQTQNNGFQQGATIVCAGAFCNELVPVPSLNSLSGHGLLFNGTWKKEPMMLMPIPHKHFKVFQFDEDRIWFGDSVAIKHQNYVKNQETYINKSLNRAREYFGLINPAEIVFGMRPYVGVNAHNPKMGHLERISRRVWVMTGGWKMGLMIYPYLAEKFIREYA